MIVRVFKYSFAHAKTRALKGKLLSAEDWGFFLRCQSLKDVIKYLSGTDYAEVLSHLPKGQHEAEVLSLAFYDELFRDYAKLLKAVPGKSSSILKAFLLRYEAENLKTILRGIWEGRQPYDIRFLLYHLGRLSQLPIGDLLQVKKIPNAIELLKPTLFYSSLIHALPQFKAQGKLFPLEIAIDTTIFENIVANLKTLTGYDRKQVAIWVGELIDFENLCWLVRFRHFYGLSPEEIINYILPGGNRLGIRDLGGLARSSDLASFLKTLPPSYRNVLTKAKDWPEIQAFFKRWFFNRLYKIFHKDPFQISIQLSYLLIKEIEVKALDGLVSVLDLGSPPENLLEFMSIPTRGASNV